MNGESLSRCVAKFLVVTVCLGCVTAFGQGSLLFHMSAIDGESPGEQWLIEPTEPNTTDVIDFSGITSTFGNSCEFESMTKATAIVTVDEEARTVTVTYEGEPGVVCPDVYLPVYAVVEGQFGPLPAGDWVFQSQHWACEFEIPFTVMSGRTITVDDDGPADFSTIQAAIDDAEDWDTVIVMPGVYAGDGNRDITFGGKAVTVTGTNPDDADAVEATVVDCGGGEAEPHRGFVFDANDGAGAVLAGLTITNGYAEDGCAVYMNGSSANIEKCVITANVSASSDIDGAGAYVRGGAPVFSGCTFKDNSTQGRGGAMFVYDSRCRVEGCTIVGNFANRRGAGICMMYYSEVEIWNCVICENRAGFQFGGGVYCDLSSLDVHDCIIAGNYAYQHGGGLSLETSTVNIDHCTIAGNTAELNWGGGVYLTLVSLTLSNSIVWANDAPEGSQIAVYSWSGVYDGYPATEPTTFLTASWCDVQGGYEQVHVFGYPELLVTDWQQSNIDADPVLTSDSRIVWGSPCRNAGDPEYAAAVGEVDIDGQERVVDDRVDIGADEFLSGPDPEITVEAEALAFAAEIEGPNPDAQILALFNSGAETLNWQLFSDSNWLTVEPDGGQSVGELDEAAVSVDISGLEVGTHLAELTVVDPCASNSPVAVPVELVISGGCLPTDHPDYAVWVAVGRPQCWCFPRQCHGDADGLLEGCVKCAPPEPEYSDLDTLDATWDQSTAGTQDSDPYDNYYPVRFHDLNTLLMAWGIAEPPHGPGIRNAGPYVSVNGELPLICADFDHAVEGGDKQGYFRVHFNDLNILIANWNVRLSSMPGDCGGTPEP